MAKDGIMFVIVTRKLAVQATIYSFSEHHLDRGLIDKDALSVIHRLLQAGFSAYLVGGSVRDLLLNRTPKDFDISTSARPEEIKRLFGRQCILIGRRFRLAHLRFGRKILEVSTFRTGESSSDLITQDNIWGSEQEDVLRRDFTINGLFYNPEDQTVIDYVGGWNDLQKGILHTIGDPETRFQQDPVRMIRLLKFQARFGFHASPEVQMGLQNCLHEITKSSPARVLEEILRMFESCASSKFFQLMIQSGLAHRLSPYLAEELDGPHGDAMLQFLAATDQINKKSSRFPIERPVLVASLIFPLLESYLKTQVTDSKQIPHQGDIFNAAHTLIQDVILRSFAHFPRKISSLMVYILVTQYRLTPLRPKRQHPIRLFKIREFPLALRLLKIRALIDPKLQDTYVAWRENYRSFLRQGERHPTHAHRHKTTRHSYEEMEAKN